MVSDVTGARSVWHARLERHVTNERRAIGRELPRRFELLGSVAGDDTILVITEKEEDAILLTDTLDKFRGVSPETSVSPVSAAQKSRAQHGGKHE
jgi:hypothetical protein